MIDTLGVCGTLLVAFIIIAVFVHYSPEASVIFDKTIRWRRYTLVGAILLLTYCLSFVAAIALIDRSTDPTFNEDATGFALLAAALCTLLVAVLIRLLAGREPDPIAQEIANIDADHVSASKFEEKRRERLKRSHRRR